MMKYVWFTISKPASAAETIINAVVNRRSIESLTPELPAGVTIFDVKQVVHTIVKQILTTSNSQSNRAYNLNWQ
ncbi:hypothetical protein MOSE0_J08790 [Monosporozyma servazzii]